MAGLSKTMLTAVKWVAKRILLAWERLESGVSLDLTSSAFIENPYRTYEQLRRKDPVHRMRLVEAWALTRYEDVQDVLVDHRRFTNAERNYDYMEYRTFLDLDPPDHTRLRGLVSKAFTPRAVRELGPRIQELVDELLDAVAGRDRIDLISDFAFPLPVIVIAEMLGVPAEDRDRFKLWSAQRARLLEPTVSPRERAIALVASAEFDAFFRGVIEERRAAPEDDILSALVQAEDEGERLSERETLNMLRLLLIAGNETTTNLIGNGVLALLRNPDQLQRLRENPDLIPAAVEELLRFDSPVQATFRRVLADCEVNGFALRKRDNLVILVGSANRDPAAFEDPDRLDVGRGEVAHLSFGRGIHHCLGAPLARLEGRIVLEMLLERFPRIDLLGDRPRFRKSIVLRGVQSLPVRCA